MGPLIARTWWLTMAAASTLAMACTSAETPPGAADAIAYEGARLITGDDRAPVEDAVFVVEDGRFVASGPRGQVNVPAGASRIDLTGKTVMPAIVDTHVHMAASRDELVEQLRHKAYYGAGVVTSLGQDTDVAFELREQTVPGAARLLTAGRGITRPEPGRSEVPYWVNAEEEARKAVQELAARRVDLVKIWVDDRNGQYEKLSPELYGAVIDEAHRHDLRVTAHIFALEDAKGLLRAGVDAFAHGVRDRDVDDELVAMMRERPDVVLVPNLPDRGVATDVSWLSGTVAAGVLQKMQAAATDRPQAQAAFGIQARNLARLHAAGVPVALGTDGSAAWAHHLEMADMVAAGMPPADVIVAATRNAADLLRLTDAGVIEPGRSADFLVLDANPIEDIANTRRISAVYLRGEAVDREGLRSQLRNTESP